MSYQCVNLAHFVAKEEGTYPDHGENDGDGAKNSLGGWDTRDLLGEIQAIDGHVQRGEDTIPPLRLLGFVCHGRNAR